MSSSRGVLTKIIFSKSSHHFEHFHILRFFHISYSLEVMNKYTLPEKPVFQLKIALKIYFRVSGIDSKQIFIS